MSISRRARQGRRARRSDLGARLSPACRSRARCAIAVLEQARAVSAHAHAAAGTLTALPQPRPALPALMPLRPDRLPDGDRSAQFRALSGRRVPPARHDTRTFSVGTRTMRLGVFPVGVETAEFERLARRPAFGLREARAGKPPRAAWSSASTASIIPRGWCCAWRPMSASSPPIPNGTARSPTFRSRRAIRN